MYLFFDTSANGNPKSWKGEHTDPFNWPRMAHLSWLLYDENRKLIEKGDYLIKPNGWEMKTQNEEKHHVTQAQMEAEGLPAREVLLKFRDVVDKGSYIISHNMNYNEGVVGGEMVRHSVAHRLHNSDKYCLMHEATWFTKLKGKGGKYKWPTLNDIYKTIFKKQFGNANKASTDVAVTAISFFKLLDMGVVEVFD